MSPALPNPADLKLEPPFYLEADTASLASAGCFSIDQLGDDIFAERLNTALRAAIESSPLLK